MNDTSYKVSIYLQVNKYMNDYSCIKDVFFVL